MFKVKIYGAGSIGNHLANASRCLGWSVCVVDTDATALTRMRDDLYPSRYGRWDENIQLYNVDIDEPVSGILLGTPPDTHLALLEQILVRVNLPEFILVEKPAVCAGELEKFFELVQKLQSSGVRVFIGYNHLCSLAFKELVEVINAGLLGDLHAVDIIWRESWAGILRAHPWLSGPSASYLGYTSRGGGALFEHSHGLNMGVSILRVAGSGLIPVSSVTVSTQTSGEDEARQFDAQTIVSMKSTTGIICSVAQDVLTAPTTKTVSVFGSAGNAQVTFGGRPGVDSISIQTATGENDRYGEFSLERPDDFIAELRTIEDALASNQAALIDFASVRDTLHLLEFCGQFCLKECGDLYG